MEIHNLLDVKSRAELREWLIQNHKTEKECWVVVKRGKPTDDNTFWYIDAVEEALCFGWIDSTTKKITDDVTAQKLCPLHIPADTRSAFPVISVQSPVSIQCCWQS